MLPSRWGRIHVVCSLPTAGWQTRKDWTHILRLDTSFSVFGSTFGGGQGVLLTLHSGITASRLWAPVGVLAMESGLVHAKQVLYVLYCQLYLPLLYHGFLDYSAKEEFSVYCIDSMPLSWAPQFGVVIDFIYFSKNYLEHCDLQSYSELCLRHTIFQHWSDHQCHPPSTQVPRVCLIRPSPSLLCQLAPFKL